MDRMILINLKFTVQPERADEWMDAVAKYTADVRSEPGNLFFEWYRPVEGGPNEYFLLEGFTDEGAQAHVASPHFQEGLDAMRPLLASTPQIISEQVRCGGLRPDGRAADRLSPPPAGGGDGARVTSVTQGAVPVSGVTPWLR